MINWFAIENKVRAFADVWASSALFVWVVYFLNPFAISEKELFEGILTGCWVGTFTVTAWIAINLLDKPKAAALSVFEIWLLVGLVFGIISAIGGTIHTGYLGFIEGFIYGSGMIWALPFLAATVVLKSFGL